MAIAVDQFAAIRGKLRIRRVKNFPEGIGAVVDHRAPVGLDFGNGFFTEPALQQGGDIVMAQIGGIHGDGRRMASQVMHDLPTLPGATDFRQHQPDLRGPGDLALCAADVKSLLLIPQSLLYRCAELLQTGAVVRHPLRLKALGQPDGAAQAIDQHALSRGLFIQ